MEHEGDAAHLAAHARERPVARCGAGEHGSGYIGNVDAVRGQIVRPDQDLEWVRIVHRAVDRHAANQRRHCHRPHQRRVGRHGIDGRRALDASGACARVRHGLRCGFQRALCGTEAGGEAYAAIRPAAPVALFLVIRLHPAHTAFHASLVAVTQAQPHRQIGMATATSADAVQALLQVGEQPLGLLARAGRLLLVTAQVGALGFEGRTDALVDGALALAQSLILLALRPVVGQRGLKLGAQLLHLGNQRRHGVARGIALDAQRLHFFRREPATAIRDRRRRRASTGEQPDGDEQHQQGHGDQQPLQESVTAHGGPPCRRWLLLLTAGDALRGRNDESLEATTARGRARASPGTGRWCPRGFRAGQAPRAGRWR